MLNLKMLRKNKKYSQKEVAEKLGISRQAYSNYELDKRNLSIVHIKALAKLFCCSINDIVDSNEDVIVYDNDEYLFVEKAVIKNIDFNYYARLDKNNVHFVFEKANELLINNLYLVEYEGEKFISKYFESNDSSIFIKNNQLITMTKEQALKSLIAKISKATFSF